MPLDTSPRAADRTAALDELDSAALAYMVAGGVDMLDKLIALRELPLGRHTAENRQQAARLREIRAHIPALAARLREGGR